MCPDVIEVHNSDKLLSVIILTYNEEINLPICLNSLKKLSAEIYIVDSGSNDRTIEIAKEYGCNIYSHPFQNQAAQINWAIDHLKVSTPWVMRLDADERLTNELSIELQGVLEKDNPHCDGYMMKRRVYFWGKWIRFGGYYPIWLLRIWRNGKAHCEKRAMDEHMVLKDGNAEKLINDIIDENHKDLNFWTIKHNEYANREVSDLLKLQDCTPILKGQAGRKRWLKQNWYRRSPLFFRAFLYWFLRYFLMLGFLDGKPGLVFHFLQGFWYRFLIDAKLYEFRKRAKER